MDKPRQVESKHPLRARALKRAMDRVAEEHRRKQEQDRLLRLGQLSLGERDSKAA